MDNIPDTKDVAQQLGITQRQAQKRVKQLYKDGIAEPEKYKDKETVSNQDVIKAIQETKIDAARLKKAQADGEELHVKQLRGELIDVKDVAEQLNQIVSVFSNKLIALFCESAPPMLEGKSAIEIKELNKKYIFELLTDLQKFSEKEGQPNKLKSNRGRPRKVDNDS